jgi:sucrose phosphorylase
MKNLVQLITYVDRLSGHGLNELHAMVCQPGGSLAGLFGGIHLLPFFYPIDGSDAGFDPIDHTLVDPRLGDWAQVKQLSDSGLDVMADVIVNHMSSNSPQFLDWIAHGEKSAYAGLFLTMSAVFPNGATEGDVLSIYRPRPGLPFTASALANGQKKMLWTTFTPQQIDINVQHAQGKAYLEGILAKLGDAGVKLLRLDAVGYAIKKAGTSCFMLPETFDFIAEFAAKAKALGMQTLVEIHSYYQKQIEIAKRVDWVYDFALPPLVLHAAFFKTAEPLKRWIAIRPSNAITVLDTHDGIGIIDIGADANDRQNSPGLVPPAELDELVEIIHRNSQGQSRQATGAAASNLDLYQVNCTFYDAFGRNDRAYLAARAIQFFLPGVPQVYYVGLLAGMNDMALLTQSKVGRDINRQHFTPADVEHALQRPVVQDLLALIKLRNQHPAFNGTFECLPTAEHDLHLAWTLGADKISLRVDLRDMGFDLQVGEGATVKTVAFQCNG